MGRFLSLSQSCPSCEGFMRVASLSCDTCDVELKAPVAVNEFAYLDEDELHLLRIFLRSEGKVREMEAPLGLSYPTIRSRIGALNEKLQNMQSQASIQVRHEKKSKLNVAQVLEMLEQKKVTVAESVELIEQVKKGN